MLMTLIVAAIACAFLPRALPHVARRAGDLLGESAAPDPGGMKVLTFALLLLAAALVVKALGVAPSPVALALGGLLGGFQAEIRRAVLDRMG
ncbi:hypothetical protein E0K89_015295 [Aquicoccus sp. SCR17]|nr:hypothetical protein [Carideicomes alvinocaridis]